MVFKLVRVDALEPYKVSLPLGSHAVGRGKLLDCNDNRVSRNHAELIVTSDSILLKSLHHNPCFLRKKSSTETIVFSQPDTQVLFNGDQFGLIPDSFWYEVIQCAEDSPNESNNIVNVCKNGNRDQHITNGETQLYKNNEDEKNLLNCSESLLDTVNKPFCLSQDNEATPVKKMENDPNKLCTDNSEHTETTSLDSDNSTHRLIDHINQLVGSPNQPVDSTNQLVESTNEPVESTNEPVESKNEPVESTNEPVESVNKLSESPISPLPTKRAHSEEHSAFEVKRVKTEPKSPNMNTKDDRTQPEPTVSNQAVKTEPKSPNMNTKEDRTQPVPTASNQSVKIEPDSPQAKPGPSNDQGASSNNGNVDPMAMPPSPAKPPNKQLRERCMYGASCYRKNPQHKAQFSHPADPDWGPGERGVCPWGASCQRTDPRHWRDHDHPPGVRPQPPRPRGNRPGMQVVRRHGNIFYISANSVRFYEDHFDVEDSDGDSVDYDYEF